MIAMGRAGPPMAPPLRRGTGIHEERGDHLQEATVTRGTGADSGGRSAGRPVLHYRIESRKAALRLGLTRSSGAGAQLLPTVM